MNTLALTLPVGNQNDPNFVSGWDLYVNAQGNIALATGSYAVAQDVASAVRLFLGELWYDISQGVPYFQQILGIMPSPQFMKNAFIAAGVTVPGVASIKCFLTGVGSSRQLGGQLQITDETGALSVLQTAVIQGSGEPWYISGASPKATGDGGP